MARERYTAEQMAEALTRARGVKEVAAKALGCARGTVERYIALYPTVREAYQQAAAAVVDAAEAQIIELIDEGDWPAVKFTLSTRGRDRGWGPEGGPEPEPEPDENLIEFEETLRRVYGKRRAGKKQEGEPKEGEEGDGEEMRGRGDS